MEGKNSTLKEEVVTLKEALNKANLEKDVLEQEKAEIGKVHYFSGTVRYGIMGCVIEC